MALQKKKIVIIGAGIAGLACASELAKLSNQLEIIVLEASNRIGGRIHTIEADDGTMLELGAHYIHGTLGNPLYDFVVAEGLLDDKKEKISPQSTVKYCFHKDLKISDEQQERIFVEASGYYSIFINELMDSSYNNIDCHKSLGSYLDERIYILLKELVEKRENPNNIKAMEAVFSNLCLEEIAYNGSRTLYDLDLRSIQEYNELEGDRGFEMYNYSSIVNRLAEKIPTIKKNHKVSKVQKVSENGKLYFEVSCTNSERFACDIVITTIPINVFKRMTKDGLFIPPLPEEKMNHCNNMAQSKIIKLLFRFKSITSNKLKNVSTIKFISTLPKQIILPNPLLVHAMEKIDNTDWWLIWIHEDFRTQIEEEGPLKFLKKIISSLAEIYPSFPRDLQIDPVSLAYKDWLVDEDYLGAYSFWKVGREKTLDVKKLQEPVVYRENNNEIHLLFSGEMTDVDFFSTTHGGFSSGLREAERVKSIFGLGS